MGKLKLWDGPPNIRSFKEGATQTFNEGDLVFFSSGSVIMATDGDDVVGVAAKDATGTTGSDIPVYVVTPEQTWSVFTSGTPARATHVGNDYDFASFSAGGMVLNLGSAGTDAIVQELDPRDTPASGTRVLVKFNPASCWMWNGS